MFLIYCSPAQSSDLKHLIYTKMSSQVAQFVRDSLIHYFRFHTKMSNHRLQSLGGPLASSWEFPSLLLGIKHNPCFEHWDQDAHNREMLKTHFRFHKEIFIYENLHLASFVKFSLTLASSCKCKCNCASWWAAPPIRMEHLLTAHELLSIRNDVRKGVADNEASSQNLHLKGRHKNCPLGDI